MVIEENSPLSQYATLNVGGPALYLCHAATLDDMQEGIALAHEKNLPFIILGGGSNILPSDAGFPGVVIKVELRGITFIPEGADTLVVAASGEVWDALVLTCVEQNLWGLENLSGIPGTVGATPVQNVGAYGVEVAEHIAWVEALDTETRTIRRFTPEECNFAYRDSFFKSPEGRRFVVTAVAFLLSATEAPILSYKDLKAAFPEGSTPTLHDIRAAVLSIRAGKFPDVNTVGTAGSFFKNPIVPAELAETLSARFKGLPAFPLPDGRVKLSLAFILEQLGFKGARDGSVGTFEKQPLVIVNTGESASAVDAFATRIASRVEEETSLVLEREVRSFA